MQKKNMQNNVCKVLMIVKVGPTRTRRAAFEKTVNPRTHMHTFGLEKIVSGAYTRIFSQCLSLERGIRNWRPGMGRKLFFLLRLYVMT